MQGAHYDNNIKGLKYSAAETATVNAQNWAAEYRKLCQAEPGLGPALHCKRGPCHQKIW